MSHSQHSDSSRSLCSRDGDEASHLNLVVHGSPAPRAQRRRTSQPPNSPTHPLSLPIDRLMYLRADLNSRLEEGCGLDSGRAGSVASSHPDLALDLSSITDSCSLTERSSTASSYDESEWTDTWAPVRSLRTIAPSITSRDSVHPLYSPFFRKANKTSDPPCRQSEHANRSGSMSSSLREREDGHSGSDRNSIRSRGSNLIEVYVETVNNAQLSKFFRQCPYCGQACCKCPPSPLDRPCEVCTELVCKCPSSSLRIDKPCVTCGNPLCECRSCTLCYRGKCSTAEASCRDDHSPSRSSSTFSQFMLERRFGPISLPNHQNTTDHAADSGNSTLQLDESSREVRPQCSTGSSEAGGILSRKHVSLSVMQLATAAQCARILADSLESVLQLARDELKTEDSAPHGELSHVSGSALHQDSLLSAFSALQIPSPSTHQESPEDPNGSQWNDQQQRNFW